MVETSIRKIEVEIDEELLATVQRLLGTTTADGTVEAAFRAVLRREEVKALSMMQGMDLANDEIMNHAW